MNYKNLKSLFVRDNNIPCDTVTLSYFKDNKHSYLQLIKNFKDGSEDIKTNKLNLESFEVEEEFDADSLVGISNDDAVFRFCFDALNAYTKKALSDYKNSFGSGLPAYGLKKLYLLCCHNQATLEQALKSNQNLTSILKMDISSNLKKTTGLSPAVLAKLEKLKLSEYSYKVSELAAMDNIDGNDINILIEFVENAKKLMGSTPFRRQESFNRFITTFNQIIELGLSVKPTISYIIRQTYGYCEFNWSNICSMTSEFKDYTRMRISLGIKEVFPSNLKRSHNSLIPAASALNDSCKENFIAAVKRYKSLEKTFDDYVVVVPNTIEELIQEGENLQHCVGTYGNLIASGVTRVLFLRKKDTPEESLVTFEINSDNKVIHAKGYANTDPEPAEAKALNRWESLVKTK